MTSSTAQGVCKKVLDTLLKEMLLSGIAGAADENDVYSLTVEQVRIEEVDGNLISVYPSRSDLVLDDSTISVIRD